MALNDLAVCGGRRCTWKAGLVDHELLCFRVSPSACPEGHTLTIAATRADLLEALKHELHRRIAEPLSVDRNEQRREIRIIPTVFARVADVLPWPTITIADGWLDGYLETRLGGGDPDGRALVTSVEHKVNRSVRECFELAAKHGYDRSAWRWTGDLNAGKDH